MPLDTDHAEPLRIDLRGARVRPRLAGGDERELLAPVQTAGLHPVDQRGRIDCRPGRDPGRQLGGPVVSQLPHAAAAGQQRLPGARRVYP